MRIRLTQDLWILIVLILLLGGISFVATREGGGGGMELIPKRSTYSSRPGGLKALYETLRLQGYPVARHLHPLTTAPKDGVLFLASPSVGLSDQEWQALRAWVERGNLLVAASGVPLPNVEPKGPARQRSVPLAPSFASPGVGTLFALERDGATPDAWEFRHGQGIACGPG